MNRGLYAGLPRTAARMRGLQVDGQLGATAVGDQTGQLVSTNTYIGYQAGQNTAQQASGVTAGSGAGQWNTFIGYQAGQTNTIGDSNVCLGYQAGYTNVTGASNVVIGYRATTTASNGIAIGYAATTASQSVVVGTSAGNSGSGLAVVIGYQAGVSSFGNTGCVAIGYSAGANGLTNGSIAIGRLAGGYNAGGGFNVAVGYNAGGASTASSTVTSSVAIGYDAQTGAGTGGVSIGYLSGLSNTSGVNVFLGYQSGYSPGTLGTTYATTTGTGQTCIGYQTGQAVVSATAPGYITCLGYETTVGASGGVAIGTDHTGAAATTSTQDAFQLGTSNHTIVSSGKVKMAAHGITSGALSTVTLSSGTGAQVDTTCDRYIAILGTAVLATDTIAIALSADNTTYTTLGTLTPGVASTDIYTIVVPAGWYCRVTASGSASIVANSVYY